MLEVKFRRDDGDDEDHDDCGNGSCDCYIRIYDLGAAMSNFPQGSIFPRLLPQELSSDLLMMSEGIKLLLLKFIAYFPH